MGTTNRSFNRHSRRAAMSNTAKTSRRHLRRKDERIAEKAKAIKASRSLFQHFQYAMRGFLGIFGIGKLFTRSTASGKPVIAAFKTPVHRKAWRCADELADRLRRRQKRRKLIMTRGYA